MKRNEKEKKNFGAFIGNFIRLKILIWNFLFDTKINTHKKLMKKIISIKCLRNDLSQRISIYSSSTVSGYESDDIFLTGTRRVFRVF